MATANMIVTQLAAAAEELQPASQRRWNSLGVMIVLVGGYVVATGAVILFSWLYGDWQDETTILFIYSIMVSVMAAIGIAVLLVLRGRSLVKVPDATRALLAALRTPDNAALPILRAQPEEVQEKRPRHRRLIGPLPALHVNPHALQWWRTLCQIGWLVVIVSNSLSLKFADISRVSATTYAQFEQRPDAAYYISIALIPVFFMGFSFFASFGLKGWQLWYDRRGLLWPRLWRWQRMAWDEIRTIGCYTHTGSISSTLSTLSLTYVIVSDTQMITWSMRTLPRPRETEMTVRFLARVMTHTGLPLRDLTPLADALAQAQESHAATYPALVGTSLAGHVSARSHHPIRAEKQLEQRAHAMLAAIVPLPRNPRWFVNVGITALLAGCLWVPYSMTIAIQSHALPGYLATLPGQIQRQTPLLSDTLTIPDGRWPIHVPTATDHARLAYTNGGYTLSGNQAGDTVVALLPDVYHAVAIQVTITQQGKLPPGASGDVGIIMRGHDAASYCAFEIDRAGNWNDTCSDVSEGGGGYSPSIQRGPDATNTLMVIARGQQYIFYANGHYLGQCFVSFRAPFGLIGLVNEESSASATFTNFAVWSISAPPSLGYV